MTNKLITHLSHIDYSLTSLMPLMSSISYVLACEQALSQANYVWKLHGFDTSSSIMQQHIYTQPKKMLVSAQKHLEYANEQYRKLWIETADISRTLNIWISVHPESLPHAFSRQLTLFWLTILLLPASPC